ncbi:MAG: hypothetical protein WCS94_03965 [Verrucomicrobiota bacterium]
MKFILQPFIKGALAAVALLVTVGVAQSEVRLANGFSDNLVLQRAMKVPVWGWATPNEKVVVKFAGQKKTPRMGQAFLRRHVVRTGGH